MKQLEMDFVLGSHIHDGGVQILSGPQGTIPLMFSRGVGFGIRIGWSPMCAASDVDSLCACSVLTVKRPARRQVLLWMYVNVS